MFQCVAFVRFAVFKEPPWASGGSWQLSFNIEIDIFVVYSKNAGNHNKCKLSHDVLALANTVKHELTMFLRMLGQCHSVATLSIFEKSYVTCTRGGAVHDLRDLHMEPTRYPVVLDVLPVDPLKSDPKQRVT